MKIILSRKGFDSGYGGCPNPILPDGTLLSLPIPSRNEKVKYILEQDSPKALEKRVSEKLKKIVQFNDN